jgi:hypothetical protein
MTTTAISKVYAIIRVDEFNWSFVSKNSEKGKDWRHSGLYYSSVKFAALGLLDKVAGDLVTENENLSLVDAIGEATDIVCQCVLSCASQEASRTA